MKKGRAGTITPDYKRHGTTTLFAALDILEGKVIGFSAQKPAQMGLKDKRNISEPCCTFCTRRSSPASTRVPSPASSRDC